MPMEMVTFDDPKPLRQRDAIRGLAQGAVAIKLAAIRRLYEAMVWRRLRQDNPAAGLKVPKGQNGTMLGLMVE